MTSCWESIITAKMASAQNPQYDYIMIDGHDLYWIETVSEKSYQQRLVRYANGSTTYPLPSDFSIGSRVHEYGGLPYTVHNETIYCSNKLNHRLYSCKNGQATPCTDGSLRIIEPIVTPCGIVGVAEKISLTSCEHFLVCIDTKTEILSSKHDFYSSPTLSTDKTTLAFITWEHPHMPWDESQLWTAKLHNGRLSHPKLVAGGNGEAIIQPKWSPKGVLHYISNKSGWQNIYCEESGNIFPLEGECGRPHWLFGTSSYGFHDDAVIAAFQQNGLFQIVQIDKNGTKPIPLPYTFTDLYSLKVHAGKATFVAEFSNDFKKILQIDLLSKATTIVVGDILKEPFKTSLCSIGEEISFPTTNGQTAYGILYLPKNPLFQTSKKPPLIVHAHGGPTSQSTLSFQMQTQFWTSRGFAILSVNYQGSFGHGLQYQQALNGFWGIRDREDCEAGARYLVEKNLVDPNRLIIRGSSAGGFTALCAITFGSVFHAACSYYGIGDLFLLSQETHNFESDYLASLIGPLPQYQKEYEARSPINFARGVKKPIIFFQGLVDPIVPPDQARKFHQALPKSKLVLYEGEGHGFKNPQVIEDALQKELEFYNKYL